MVYYSIIFLIFSVIKVYLILKIFLSDRLNQSLLGYLLINYKTCVVFGNNKIKFLFILLIFLYRILKITDKEKNL